MSDRRAKYLEFLKAKMPRAQMAGFEPLSEVSEGYQALKMRRRAVGTELNEDYWRFSVGYAEAVEAEMDVPTLFDLNGIAV